MILRGKIKQKKCSKFRASKGFDGGKLVKGRKRHIIVDVMGLLLAVIVHSAGIQERRGLKFLRLTT